jgi:hypothetical protein
MRTHLLHGPASYTLADNPHYHSAFSTRHWNPAERKRRRAQLRGPSPAAPPSAPSAGALGVATSPAGDCSSDEEKAGVQVWLACAHKSAALWQRCNPLRRHPVAALHIELLRGFWVSPIACDACHTLLLMQSSNFGHAQAWVPMTVLCRHLQRSGRQAPLQLQRLQWRTVILGAMQSQYQL